MLSFFRRVLSSWVAVAIFGVVMIAFIVTGVASPDGGSIGGASNSEVARVGKSRITATEIAERLEGELRRLRQQQPEATMEAMLAANGGIDAVVDQAIATKLLEEWGRRHGITATDRLVDGEIASIPAFQGPTGRFDERQMQAVIAQQRLSYVALRDGFRGDMLRRQLLVPITAGTRGSLGLATPYAALLLDRREGVIGMVPANRAAVPAPSPADIERWYREHTASYSLPERRVLRYALIGADNVRAAAPTEAEIAAAYKADAAKYAARETRSVSRVTLPDEAAARAFVTKAGATSFARAAADAGFPTADLSLGGMSREALAEATSREVATAVFATPNGGTTAPIRTGLGWMVAHVDAIQATPARQLAQVRDELAAEIAKRKLAEATAALVEKVEAAISGGETFDEAVKESGLTAVVTPPLTAMGVAPTDPGFKADEVVTALLKPAFDAAPDDEPTVEPVGADQRHALLALGEVIPSAPLPLAQVRERVVQDLTASRAADQAKKQAEQILAKINGGTAPAAAFTAAGLPAPQATSATQLQLTQLQGQVPEPLRALFRLTAGKSELVAGPDGSWFIVRLDRIVPGDKEALPPITRAVQSDIGRTLAEEYVQQFANAVRSEIKVRRNANGIAALQRQLISGQ